MLDVESIQLSPELLFSACNEDESMTNSSDAPLIDAPEHSSPSSLSGMTTSVVPTQDFDLVKNILSEIFDTSDENLMDGNLSELLNLDQHEDLLAMPTTTSNNDDDDFRFLDDMLASIDVSDAAIHEMTPAEIDRVDSLLKDIVSAQQADETSPPSLVNERESQSPSSLPERIPSPTDESSTSSSLPAMVEASASSPPIDEELVRVEQEWSQLSEDDKKLGSIAPEWVNDDQAPACMKCTNRFSITRRRHHCRACGKVYCATCCWQKAKLIHDDNKEDRTCNDCVKTMNRGRLILVRANLTPLSLSLFLFDLSVEYLWTYMRNNQKPRTSVLRKRTGNSSLTNPWRSDTNRGLA